MNVVKVRVKSLLVAWLGGRHARGGSGSSERVVSLVTLAESSHRSPPWPSRARRSPQSGAGGVAYLDAESGGRLVPR